jgi:hypothetical protein
VRNDRLRVIVPAHVRDHAVIASLPKLHRHIVQLREELVEVGGIARALARKSCRAHARPAVERIHLDAGVIRQRRQARLAGRVTGLDERVVEKRGAGFRRRVDAERRLRDERETQRPEDRRQLLELAGVAARQDGSHGSHALRAGLNGVRLEGEPRHRSGAGRR